MVKLISKLQDLLLKALNVDAHGLDEMDNKILSTIIDKFKGGPRWINNISYQFPKVEKPLKKYTNLF